MPLDRQWQSGGFLVAKLLFTAPFLDDLAQLDERVEAEVWRKLELVQSVPGVGTSLVEPQLIRSYGTSCLKIAVFGYDVLYERHPSADDAGDEFVVVLGIISQRRVR